MNRVEIYVPSSTANVGPGFDAWSMGFDNPKLMVTAEIIPNGIEVVVDSRCTAPGDRKLGWIGQRALEHFREKHRIKDGIRVVYKDVGGDYPVGGLGRSGAEDIGGLLAGHVLFEKRLSREKLIRYAALFEGHADNVASSANGNFNVVVIPPGKPVNLGSREVKCYKVPDNLGAVICSPSHEKADGTEGRRKVLPEYVSRQDFVTHTGRVSVAAAELALGNTDEFLRFIWEDIYHEPSRADAGSFGNFNATELTEEKRMLYDKFGVAWVVSGAGPRMLGLYNKNRYPDGVISAIAPELGDWYKRRGMTIELMEMKIASEGAYGYAQRVYNF